MEAKAPTVSIDKEKINKNLKKGFKKQFNKKPKDKEAVNKNPKKKFNKPENKPVQKDNDKPTNNENPNKKYIHTRDSSFTWRPFEEFFKKQNAKAEK